MILVPSHRPNADPRGAIDAVEVAICDCGYRSEDGVSGLPSSHDW